MASGAVVLQLVPPVLPFTGSSPLRLDGRTIVVSWGPARVVLKIGPYNKRYVCTATECNEAARTAGGYRCRMCTSSPAH
jgi:hypothetical protein